jgi:hypothetical protein
MTLRRALAALAMMLAGAIAFAQNANQDARELAQRLGRERSVDGLETIAASRNRELLEWYERGYRETWMKDRRAPHPAGIEPPLRAWLADAKAASEEARTLENFLALLAEPPPPPLTPEQLRQAKNAQIASRIAQAERLRSPDPKGYLDAMQAALGEAEQTNEAAMGWLQLGNFARFRLRDPRRALELYGRAERAGMGLAIFAQGDTWQFDLRDKQRAIAEYRRNLEKLAQVEMTGNRGESFVAWGRHWLTSQIAYLESGRTFTGAIGRDDIAGVGILTMFAAMPPGKDDDLGLFPGGEIDPKDIPRRLADLPPSGWTLMRAASLLGGMPDAKGILAFLARNDPAGYASACFFGLVDLTARQQAQERGGMVTRGANRMFGGSQALQDAKAQFLRDRKISLLPLLPQQ